MTPEEKAVIEAAIMERNDLGRMFARTELTLAVDALLARQAFLSDGETAIAREGLKRWDPDYPGCAPEECGGSRLDPCSTVMHTKGARHDGDDWVNAGATSCPQCNRSGHTCPGDGNGIAHGETDCGQHDDCSSEHGIGHDTCPKCWVRKNGGPRFTWKPATFGDLLPGDRARIGQEETTVTRVSRDQWHAKDRQWVDDNGKVRDHMTPWEHEELRIDFTVNPGMRVYPPDVECEILCDAERAALLLLQRGFPGSTVVS